MTLQNVVGVAGERRVHRAGVDGADVGGAAVHGTRDVSCLCIRVGVVHVTRGVDCRPRSSSATAAARSRRQRPEDIVVVGQRCDEAVEVPAAATAARA